MENIKILIVEDELLIAENLAMKLKKFGYIIGDIVSSGKAALEYIKSDKPDLILMDIAIKGSMDGIETAAKIGEIEKIPIVYLTAYADDKTLDRASQTNCYGYILKPFKDRELHATIKITLKKHQEQTEIQNSFNEAINQYFSEENSISIDSHIDSLTQLPNRLLVRELFEQLLSKYKNPSNPSELQPQKQETAEHITNSNISKTNKTQTNKNILGIIYLELDKLQRINDSLGNESGDLLIQGVAERLKKCSDNCDDNCGGESCIARLHNSEFVILLGGITLRQQAGDFARIVLERLNKPFSIGGKEIFLTASIGIALYPLDQVEIDRLLKQAKRAMKHAQEQGGNQYKFYTAALKMSGSLVSEDYLSLETDLHYGLERKELELYYQPKINLRTGQIESTEALIRWNHPKLGVIPPDKFIDIAEASSLMESIGEWALKEACQKTHKWHQAGFNYLTTAINLSGCQFKQLDLFHKLTQILFDSNLDPQFLELELTEKILVDNVKANVQRMNLIKKLGIKIAIDDFGTGYSSLGYLQQFPFDTLKIHRSFLKNIDRNPTNAIITKSIIEMAHQLKLKVVAEGVETQAELAFLVEHKCDRAQGYLFSRPLPTKEFEQLLLSRKCFPIPNSAFSTAKP